MKVILEGIEEQWRSSCCGRKLQWGKDRLTTMVDETTGRHLWGNSEKIFIYRLLYYDAERQSN